MSPRTPPVHARDHPGLPAPKGHCPQGHRLARGAGPGAVRRLLGFWDGLAPPRTGQSCRVLGSYQLRASSRVAPGRDPPGCAPPSCTQHLSPGSHGPFPDEPELLRVSGCLRTFSTCHSALPQAHLVAPDSPCPTHSDPSSCASAQSSWARTFTAALHVTGNMECRPLAVVGAGEGSAGPADSEDELKASARRDLPPE